jgi:hypothetical protein
VRRLLSGLVLLVGIAQLCGCSLPAPVAAHEPGSVTGGPRLSCPATPASTAVPSHHTWVTLSAFVDGSGHIVIRGQRSPHRWVPELCLRTGSTRATIR